MAVLVQERIGQLLLKANLITEEQLEIALNEQKKIKKRLGTLLIELGYITEQDLLYFLSKQYNVENLDISNIVINQDVINIIPSYLVKKYFCLPVNLRENVLIIGMVDPSNIFAIDDIKFYTGYTVVAGVISETAFRQAYEKYYKKTSNNEIGIDVKDYSFGENDTKNSDSDFEDDSFDDSVIELSDFDNIVKGALDNVEVIEEDEDDNLNLTGAEAPPIIKLVNGILIRAIKMGTSDIHIEPYEKQFRVRYRIDGSLKKIMSLPIKIKNSVTSRIKIMAKLDIAEKRLPQDGRIKLKLGRNKSVDFRVSVLPTLFGEKIVLRLLDKSNLQVDMTNLGFEEDSLAKFKEAIDSPYGMILVTGPTGSGKTTTLYSALTQVNREDINIMTAEDPVEFNFMGINQVQTKDSVGLTFAAALRSFLRQDPDVIMVGEIRDYETAEIGIKAALTGHLVFSTLHTNDAPGTINRLLNMGIEPFLVASSILIIVAQRLARKLCSKCKEAITVANQILTGIGFSKADIENGIKIYKAKGCAECNQNGYKGRVALYEVMKISDSIKDTILKNGSLEEIKTTARSEGMRTLRESGLLKIREGITSIEEIVAVTMAD